MIPDDVVYLGLGPRLWTRAELGRALDQGLDRAGLPADLHRVYRDGRHAARVKQSRGRGFGVRAGALGLLVRLEQPLPAIGAVVESLGVHPAQDSGLAGTEREPGYLLGLQPVRQVGRGRGRLRVHQGCDEPLVFGDEPGRLCGGDGGVAHRDRRWPGNCRRDEAGGIPGPGVGGDDQLDGLLVSGIVPVRGDVGQCLGFARVLRVLQAEGGRSVLEDGCVLVFGPGLEFLGQRTG